MMVKAGFAKVFVGIETPEESCLMECNKLHNNNRDLIESVGIIQRYGMEVYAGFMWVSITIRQIYFRDRLILFRRAASLLPWWDCLMLPGYQSSTAGWKMREE